MDHPIPVNFIRWIILLPAIGAAINFLLGWWLQEKFGKRAISIVGCGVVIGAFLLAVWGFTRMLALPHLSRFMLDSLWPWLTIGGINIFFINLLPVVFFVIFDAWVLSPIVEERKRMGQPIPAFLAIIGSRLLIFLLSLLSVIPLSYFIGMAVASISAQSSIGMGAVINATFGSIIEILLYAFALTEGKGRLVEGSIVGSLLAGVLLMPGVSMISVAMRRKEQKFNAKSAGVTSTMLIMAIIGTLTPTLFYQTYGNVRILRLYVSLLD